MIPDYLKEAIEDDIKRGVDYRALLLGYMMGRSGTLEIFLAGASKNREEILEMVKETNAVINEAYEYAHSECLKSIDLKPKSNNQVHPVFQPILDSMLKPMF